MIKSDAERRDAVRSLEAGDLIVSLTPCSREVYFAVLERDGVKVVLSMGDPQPEKLSAIKSIAGVMEITEDGTLNLEDGSHTIFGDSITDIRRHEVMYLAERFARRPRPRQSVVLRGIRVEASEDLAEKVKRIRELVFNQDCGGKFTVLFEVFFRIIGKDCSSEESAFYLMTLLLAVGQLNGLNEDIAFRKEISGIFEHADNVDDLSAAMDVINSISGKKK